LTTKIKLQGWSHYSFEASTSIHIIANAEDQNVK